MRVALLAACFARRKARVHAARACVCVCVCVCVCRAACLSACVRAYGTAGIGVPLDVPRPVWRTRSHLPRPSRCRRASAPHPHADPLPATPPRAITVSRGCTAAALLSGQPPTCSPGSDPCPNEKGLPVTRSTTTSVAPPPAGSRQADMHHCWLANSDHKRTCVERARELLVERRLACRQPRHTRAYETRMRSSSSLDAPTHRHHWRTVSRWSACDVVSTWSAHGQQAVSTRPAHGQQAISTWRAHGQHTTTTGKRQRDCGGADQAHVIGDGATAIGAVCQRGRCAVCVCVCV